MEELIEIPVAVYKELLDDCNKLYFLEAEGVDNWSGYDYAMDAYREDKNKKESE